ncbi:ABC transporter permease [Anoxynatronum buryatiense]|uniref:ABC-type transport system, involved in lipoprotein release, permease component n=1 Tax=Anoxynatronum buryatiense TaxID=489973 RepID=A0AA45WTV0_9CLOT|nr:ABC transporter permease [Anoxynatronum buryatiense]SMP44735.1 ABC-type transport system, involved in lipoprotein release, permease component [Anoxynatronum buryatiense]
MNNRDLLLMGLGNLFRRKTRTVLTVLGVVIGTCSIVVMLSLGIAMDRGFQEQLSYMGDLTIIDVNNYGYYDGGMGSGGQQIKLDDQSVIQFQKIPRVTAVMPVRSIYMKMAAGRYVGYVNVIGIDPEVMEPFGFSVEDGRLLQASDRDTIVFGKSVAYDFYNPRMQRNYYYGMNRDNPPPVDVLSAKMVMTTDMQYGETRNRWQDDTDSTPPKVYDVRGVGILEESNSEKDYSAYMNRSSLEKIMEEERRNNRNDRSRNDQSQFERVRVKVDNIEDVESVQSAIQALGYQTFSLTDILNSMKETSRMIQGILGGIGAVSLLVAAIGITNTMVMSIYERTREIGVMKVIGAQLTDIKKLFLIEAGLIGFSGGVVGVCFSYLISVGLNHIGAGFMGPGSTSGMSVIPLQLALMAIAFSTLIGIVSGYSPARRAMKLSALEAIRND